MNLPPALITADENISTHIKVERISLMWIADKWKDYEIIDCSNGEKLERWGKYLLVRPDPQVIWDTPKQNRGWKKMNGHYHRSKKAAREWEFFDLPQQWQIHYKDLTFNLKPFSFKHTDFSRTGGELGLVFRKDQNAGRPVKVLNLFAYTGGGHTRCSCGRSPCHSCRRFQRHGRMGKRERRFLGLKDAPIRWRLTTAPNSWKGRSAVEYLRRHHHGSALLRQRPQR